MSSEQFPFPHANTDDQDFAPGQDPNLGSNDPANTAHLGDEARSTRFEELFDRGAMERRGHRTVEATRINLETGQSDVDDLVDNFNAWLERHGDAEQSAPESQPAAEAESTAAPEATPTRPEAEHKPNLLSDAARRALKAVGLVAITLYATFVLSACGDNKKAPDNTPDPSPSASDTDLERPTYNPEEAQYNSLTGSEFLDETIDGSFNQYDGGGHDTSYAKDPTLKEQGYPDIYSENSFANVAYILTIMNDNDLIADPYNISPDEYAMVEKYNAFREKEKAAFIAVSNNLAGFEGLSYKAAVDKVADMTPFEKEAFQKQLQNYFNNTTFSIEEVTGDITNHYITEDEKGEHDVEAYSSHIDGTSRAIVMTYTDPDTGLQYITRSLARCDNPFIIVERVNPDTGQKDVIIVTKDDPTEFPPADTDTGKPAGGDPTGGKPAGGDPGTEQPGNNTPSNNTPSNNDPGNPPSTPPEQTNNSHTPKNEDAEIQNAGPNVTQTPVNNDVTPPTTQEQDQSNFNAIRDQQAADQAAAAEAARLAEQQRQAEEAARLEAERRAAEAAARQAAQDEAARRAEAERQAAADRAAAEAAAQAAAQQQAAAEAERQRAAEEAARQAAQEAANNQAQNNAAEAASHANDTANDRSNLFNNGDF